MGYRDVMTPLLGLSGGKTFSLDSVRGSPAQHHWSLGPSLSLKIMNTLTKEEGPEQVCGPSKGTQQHKGLFSEVSSCSQISAPGPMTCLGTSWTGRRAVSRSRSFRSHSEPDSAFGSLGGETGLEGLE